MGRKIRKKNKWEKTETENNNKEQGGGGAKKLQKKTVGGGGVWGETKWNEKRSLCFSSFFVVVFLYPAFLYFPFVLPAFCVFIYLFFLLSKRRSRCNVFFHFYFSARNLFATAPHPPLLHAQPALLTSSGEEKNKIKYKKDAAKNTQNESQRRRKMW